MELPEELEDPVALAEAIERKGEKWCLLLDEVDHSVDPDSLNALLSALRGLCNVGLVRVISRGTGDYMPSTRIVVPAAYKSRRAHAAWLPRSGRHDSSGDSSYGGAGGTLRGPSGGAGSGLHAGPPESRAEDVQDLVAG